MKYTAQILTDNSVTICRDGIFATSGRLDKVCLERGEAHIVDADAPLGDNVYDELDIALTSALEAGQTEATITV